MEKKIIAIIGAPRSGKSFLVNRLAQKLGFRPFLEGHDDTFPDFLEQDIKHNQNSLRRILWFRNRQVTHFLQAVDLKKSGQGVILDTFWFDNQMYVDVLLSGHDRDVANEMMQIDLKSLEWPDILVYLKNNEEGTRKFIELGGRDFDSKENFYEEIVAPLQKEYEKIFTLVPPTTRLIEIDRSSLDFDKEEDLDLLIQKIGS